MKEAYSCFKSRSYLAYAITHVVKSIGTAESHVLIAIGIHVRLCSSNTVNGTRNLKRLYTVHMDHVNPLITNDAYMRQIKLHARK